MLWLEGLCLVIMPALQKYGHNRSSVLARFARNPMVARMGGALINYAKSKFSSRGSGKRTPAGEAAPSAPLTFQNDAKLLYKGRRMKRRKFVRMQRSFKQYRKNLDRTQPTSIMRAPVVAFTTSTLVDSQIVEYIPICYTGNGTAATGFGDLQYLATDAAAQIALKNATAGTSSAMLNKYEVVKCVTRLDIHNSGGVPVYIDLYECVCRKNYQLSNTSPAINLTTYRPAGEGTLTQTAPNTSPFHDPTFTSQFRILNVKQLLIASGGNSEVVQKNKGRMFDGTECQNGGFGLGGWTKFWVMIVKGQVDANGASARYQAASISWVNTRFYHYKILSPTGVLLGTR